VHPACSGDFREVTMAIANQIILVVDDDKDMLRAIEAILLRGGYSPIIALGPREALEKSRDFEGDIHLLLSDVTMPEMDGVTLAERVLAERPYIRVLLISGYATGRPRFPLLNKPLRMTQLLEQVSKAIDGPPPLPAHVYAAKHSTGASARAALTVELDEERRRYLESSQYQRARKKLDGHITAEHSRIEPEPGQ